MVSARSFLQCTCLRQTPLVAATPAACLSSRNNRAGLRPARRHFSASSSRLSSAQRVADHPHLWLHPSKEKGKHVLSMLPSPPIIEESPTVIGLVEGSSLNPVTFEENPEWRFMLHHVLSEVYMSDEGLQTTAKNRDEGYIHIIDERNIPPMNRAGEPDDIIASVLCQDGQLVEGTYEPGDAYRIVTTNGPTRLSQSLTEKLVNALEVARTVEEQMKEDGAFE